jgi:hypothetical protein
MSEITRGVIGMPFKLAMGSEMSRRQFHACAQEVFVEKERLEAQVATLKADPNSWQSGYDEGRKMGTKTALSEREQLRSECEESAGVIDRLAQILAGVAVALKGEELPLHRHGYHDLVEGVNVLKLETELLKAENERLQSAARTLSNLGYIDNGGELWKPPLGKKPDFDLIDSLHGKIDRLLAHCPDGECATCGEIICPHGGAMHFHHDGCPSCSEHGEAEREQQS